MNFYQVKNAIFQTDCGKQVKDGLCCSYPVMTKDERGIIDHYFIYGWDEERHLFSGPLKCFGIYSDMKQTAYISLPSERGISISPDDELREKNPGYYNKAAYQDFTETFPKVREFLMKENCTNEEKRQLKKYLDGFLDVTDDGLLPVYRELAPDFFNWAERQLS